MSRDREVLKLFSGKRICLSERAGRVVLTIEKIFLQRRRSTTICLDRIEDRCWIASGRRTPVGVLSSPGRQIRRFIALGARQKRYFDTERDSFGRRRFVRDKSPTLVTGCAQRRPYFRYRCSARIERRKRNASCNIMTNWPGRKYLARTCEPMTMTSDKQYWLPLRIRPPPPSGDHGERSKTIWAIRCEKKKKKN